MIPPPITSPADEAPLPAWMETAIPAAPPPPPPPSIAACVRFDLVGFAHAIARRTLARTVRNAATAEEWADVAWDFAAASRSLSDESWRGSRAASRAAIAMSQGRTEMAAAALADFYGLTVETWHWSTADEITRGGAR